MTSTARAVVEAFPTPVFVLLTLVTVANASVPTQSGSTHAPTASPGLCRAPLTACSTAGATHAPLAERCSPGQRAASSFYAGVAEQPSPCWTAQSGTNVPTQMLDILAHNESARRPPRPPGSPYAMQRGRDVPSQANVAGAERCSPPATERVELAVSPPCAGIRPHVSACSGFRAAHPCDGALGLAAETVPNDAGPFFISLLAHELAGQPLCEEPQPALVGSCSSAAGALVPSSPRRRAADYDDYADYVDYADYDNYARSTRSTTSSPRAISLAAVAVSCGKAVEQEGGALQVAAVAASCDCVVEQEGGRDALTQRGALPPQTRQHGMSVMDAWQTAVLAAAAALAACLAARRAAPLTRGWAAAGGSRRLLLAVLVASLPAALAVRTRQAAAAAEPALAEVALVGTACAVAVVAVCVGVASGGGGGLLARSGVRTRARSREPPQPPIAEGRRIDGPGEGLRRVVGAFKREQSLIDGAGDGLFAAATIPQGTLFEVNIAEVHSIDAAGPELEAQLISRIKMMEGAERRYTFELWSATEMRADEEAVYAAPPDYAPAMLSRAEIEQHVRLRPFRRRVFAVCEGDSSPIMLANDGAYAAGCTRAQYERNVSAGANNAVFEAGIAASGHQKKLFLRATRPIAEGEELLVDYGFGYWEQRSADRRQVARKRVRQVARESTRLESAPGAAGGKTRRSVATSAATGAAAAAVVAATSVVKRPRNTARKATRRGTATGAQGSRSRAIAPTAQAISKRSSRGREEPLDVSPTTGVRLWRSSNSSTGYCGVRLWSNSTWSGYRAQYGREGRVSYHNTALAAAEAYAAARGGGAEPPLLPQLRRISPDGLALHMSIDAATGYAGVLRIKSRRNKRPFRMRLSLIHI